MRKLLLVLSAATIVSVAQASSLRWQFAITTTNEAAKTAQKLSGYTAYLLLADDWNKLDVDGSLASAVTNVPSTSWARCEHSNVSSAYTINTLTVKGLDIPPSVVSTNCYIVFANNDNYWVSDSPITGVSVYPDGSLYPPGKVAMLLLRDEKAIKTTDVRPIVAPEPTSALLLMLGLAGLALRRKVA